MDRRSIDRGSIIALVLVAAVAAGTAAPRAGDEPLGVQERAAIARVRALESLRGLLPWQDFDPTEYPFIVHAPGEWALAFGFEAPPDGFATVDDVIVAGRPVTRNASCSFAPPPWSPAKVGGSWAVISEAVAPEAAPAGSHLGGPSSEETLARMVGDAFGLYLMRKRGTSSPHVAVPVGYPDSPELIALTSLERKILLELFRIKALTELTIPNQRRLSRQAIAVHEERARLIGPELAAAERDVERWDGLRADAAQVVHKLAMQGSFRPEGLEAADPGFNGNSISGLNRGLLLSYPTSLVVDGPAATVAQIAGRFCALGFAAERMDGAWRIRAVDGDRSVIDILAAALGAPREGETTSAPELLTQAKESFDYDLLLDAGREVLQRITVGREAILAAIGAGADKVVIRLNGAAVTEYVEDAATARHLGGGSLLHEKALTVRTTSLELQYLPARPVTPLRVITRSTNRSDRIAEIALVGAPGRPPLSLFESQSSQGGMETGLKLEGEGLKARIARARVTKGAEGETIIEVDEPAPRPTK